MGVPVTKYINPLPVSGCGLKSCTPWPKLILRQWNDQTRGWSWGTAQSLQVYPLISIKFKMQICYSLLIQSVISLSRR